MALVNPNIAMSFRMPEFTPRNALAEYAQIQQIQSGQRQAEVADMQLAQMRQKEKAISDIQAKAAQGGGPTDRRAIARAYIQSGNPEFMQFGLTMETTLDELDAFKNIMGTGGGSGAAAAPAAPAAGMGLPAGAQTPGDFTSTEAMGRVPGVVTSPIPDSPPMSAAMPAPANALAPTPPTPPAPTNALTNPVAALRAKRDQLIALGTPRAIQAAKSMDADIALMSRESRMYTVPGVGLVDPTGRVITPSVATPAAPPAAVAEYTFAKTPEGGNFQGSFQQFITARAAAGRAPAQPVAPTITQIVDPTNPNQMITVDARRYTGGGTGSPGVLGVGGKEPGAAIRTNKTEEGKTQLSNDLDNLRSSFVELDRLRAIPSTGRNVASNLMAAAQSSTAGQMVGRAAGTREQVERDVINSARLRLVSSIKNATGMSSKSLDSNVELQTMLRSLSDPGQSVDAALRIIDDIETAYVKGAGMPKKDAPAGGKPAASGATGGWSVVK
jgi:hypothetical protein